MSVLEHVKQFQIELASTPGFVRVLANGQVISLAPDDIGDLSGHVELEVEYYEDGITILNWEEATR